MASNEMCTSRLALIALVLLLERGPQSGFGKYMNNARVCDKDERSNNPMKNI